MPGSQFDVCIVGAGIVGLAVGRALAAEFVGISILIVDKEDRVAAHQSGHNSGVVHSGLYYRPGSLKAQLCVEGRDSVYELAESAGIPIKRSGKLVIATRPAEIPALEELQRRGTANGLIGMRRVGPAGIRDIEPAATGIDALQVPEAGVVDFVAVAEHIAADLTASGSRVATGHGVTSIVSTPSGVTVVAGDESFTARTLVNCAGLHSDRIAALCGIESAIRIVPFRGEYYRLAPAAASLVQGLVYPVPDPRFPFLGVHFTRRIDGSVEVGPNAVLALGREHYRGAKPNWADVRDTLSSAGFRKLAARNLRSGVKEMMSSRSRRLYARLARRLIPATLSEHLLPGGAGVRAQAIAPDGSLVDDFVIEQAGATLHVLNAPSPGATAGLAIGRQIAARLGPMLQR